MQTAGEQATSVRHRLPVGEQRVGIDGVLGEGYGFRIVINSQVKLLGSESGIACLPMFFDGTHGVAALLG